MSKALEHVSTRQVDHNLGDAGWTTFIKRSLQGITAASLQQFHERHFRGVPVPPVLFSGDDFPSTGHHVEDGFVQVTYPDGTPRYLSDDQIEYLRYREIVAALQGKTLEELLDEGVKTETGDAPESTDEPSKRRRKRKNNNTTKKRAQRARERELLDDPLVMGSTPNRLARELDETRNDDVVLDY